MLTPTEHSIRARLGAHAAHSKHDSRVLTTNARAKARANLDARLLGEIDPDNLLNDAERARRLEHARKAHFARLALQSAIARRKKAGAK